MKICNDWSDYVGRDVKVFVVVAEEIKLILARK